MCSVSSSVAMTAGRDARSAAKNWKRGRMKAVTRFTGCDLSAADSCPAVPLPLAGPAMPPVSGGGEAGGHTGVFSSSRFFRMVLLTPAGSALKKDVGKGRYFCRLCRVPAFFSPACDTPAALFQAFPVAISHLPPAMRWRCG